MKCLTRYQKYQHEPLDSILLKIKTGEIKCGKYADLVKIDKNFKFKGKELLGRNGQEKD